MRLFALGLLLLMTLAFVVASALAARLPFLVYPRAFAEAAMVGACADWFATTPNTNTNISAALAAPRLILEILCCSGLVTVVPRCER